MQRFIVSNIHLHNTNKLRLDDFLSTQLQSSKNQIHSLIKNQKVSLNGIICTKKAQTLKEKDYIEVEIYEDTHNDCTSSTLAFSADDERFKIDIIFEDNDLLIINKPPHLVVHEAPSLKEPTLTDWLKAHKQSLHTLSGEERYGIVHRLDRQTSGALAIAKSHLAYSTLPEELKNRQMGRYYLAIIDMPLKADQQVSCFMGRNPHNRLKMGKINIDKAHLIPKGVRDSKSSFIKLAQADNGKCELIAIKLHTGRTHQIRVHLETLSRHILGDTLYGYKSHANTYHYNGRILLHAYILYLKHPKTQEECIFKAPILRDMLQFMQTHFTKDMPNDRQDIMQLLEVNSLMRAFEHFS